MRHWVGVVSCCALFGAGTVGAGGQGLTLEQAIESARRENRELTAARQVLEVAGNEVKKARAAFLPELGTMASFSRYQGEVFFARFVNPQDPGQPQGQVGGTDIGSFDSTEAALLQISQTIYAGGANGAALRASRIQQQIAEQEVRRHESDVIAEVSNAYYDVLLSEEAEATAQNSVRRSEQNLRAIERLRAEEEALEVDVLAAQAQLAADRHTLDQASNDLQLARYALNRLLNREWTEELELSDSLERSPAAAGTEAHTARAIESSPEVSQARLGIDLSKALVKGARSYFVPKLELDGMFSYLNNDLFFKGTYWAANLNISIPFARDALEGAGELGRARAQQSRAESMLEDTVSAVQLLFRQAETESKERHAEIGVSEQNLRYHEERYRVTESAFAEGLATFTDLLEDHVDLSEAELALLHAHYQARLAEAEVRRLLGEP